MTARERAEDLLVFYVRKAWEAAGLKWDSDNDSEVRSIVDAALDAALLDAKAEVETLRSELENRVRALEGSTPAARQAQYEADVAVADLAASGYDDWPDERGFSEYHFKELPLEREEPC